MDQFHSGHNINVEENPAKLIPLYRRAFLDEVSQVVDDLATLQAYLKRLIVRWRLSNVDTSEVLSEAISRGVHYIETKGEPIDNPVGWLRAVSVNILRDEAKAAARQRRLQEKLLSEYTISSRDLFQDLDFLEDVEDLQLAMQTLSKTDQDMLRCRFFLKKRYKEIQAELEIEEGKKTAISTLRKRESRALQRLKEAFLRLRSSDQ